MKRWLALVLVAVAALAAALMLRGGRTSIGVSLFQRQISPARLSAVHASLESNCAACHTPLKGADTTKCIVCHANNTALLQRQPTAFHATINTCRSCHPEHRGSTVRPITMDHLTLANLGLEIIRRDAENPSNRRLLAWLRQHETAAGESTHPRVTSTEATLNCASCHSTKDRHQKLLGEDCASCHATASWTIAEFTHPSPRSTDCVQCHRGPPSHYMMHFQMVSQAVARVPDARVDQCFRCHQTTSWNDIQGIGWYKHH